MGRMRTERPPRAPHSPSDPSGQRAVKFVKMQGLGNDFALVDATETPFHPEPGFVRALAERRTGIGFDQMLVLEPSDDDDALCRYRVFNADGSEARHCGNGVRCIGLYLYRSGRAGADPFRIIGPAGPVTVSVPDAEHVTVNMGEPVLDPERIPFVARDTAIAYELDVDGETVSVVAVSMGNPHAVLLVDDATGADVARLGPAIEGHERFPDRANVGFMQILDPAHVRLRVYERGVGETRACGSGACAAVVAGRLLDRLGERVEVALPGGTLVIEWKGMHAPVWMTGPATWVYEGIIEP